MKIITSGALPKLPDNVKELVSDGIYALFSVDHGEEEYAVVASRDSIAFLLGHEGEVVQVVTGAEYSSLDLKEAVTFSSVGNVSIRINAA